MTACLLGLRPVTFDDAPPVNPHRGQVRRQVDDDAVPDVGARERSPRPLDFGRSGDSPATVADDAGC